MSISSTVDKSGPVLLTALPQVVPTVIAFQQGSDLIVYDIGSVGTPIDPPLTLILGSDYSVTAGGYDSFNQMQVGSITVVSGGVSAVQIGHQLVIARNVPINQVTSFEATGPLTIQLLEQALDKTATIDQQLNDGVSRSLRFEGSEFLDGTLIKTARAGNLLGFDASGIPTFYGVAGITGGVFGAGYGLTLTSNIFATDRTKIGSIALNIAALKALTVSNYTTGAQVMISGYYTAGDGGGGLFTYNSASAATDNGGTVIAPTVGAGRWLRATPNTQINVRQFGAKGDGATDDTVSIAKAFVLAVATPASGVYIPAGTYRTACVSVTSATGLAIYGDGMGVSILKGTAPTRMLEVFSSTSVQVRGLTFDGQCVTRTAGQQAVTMDCSKSSFTFCEILNSGEFAFYAGDRSQVTDLTVSNNYIHDCYADGIHFDWVTGGLIANNLILRMDDDCIALYYNGLGIANQIEVIGNYMTARNDLGTTTGRGIAVVRAFNCLITGNYMRGIKQSGIWLNNEGGSRVQNVVVSNNNVTLACISSGYAIAAYATTDCVLADNMIQNPIAATACIDIADWQNLRIVGGSIIQENNIFSRGIHAEESAGWAASWNRLFISGVTISMIGASTEKCIYLAPHAGVTMNTVIIQNVIGYQVTAGDYINVAAASTGTLAKIVNNTFAGAGTTTTPAASAGVFIIAGNN